MGVFIFPLTEMVSNYLSFWNLPFCASSFLPLVFVSACRTHSFLLIVQTHDNWIIHSLINGFQFFANTNQIVITYLCTISFISCCVYELYNSLVSLGYIIICGALESQSICTLGITSSWKLFSKWFSPIYILHIIIWQWPFSKLSKIIGVQY